MARRALAGRPTAALLSRAAPPAGVLLRLFCRCGDGRPPDGAVVLGDGAGEAVADANADADTVLRPIARGAAAVQRSDTPNTSTTAPEARMASLTAPARASDTPVSCEMMSSSTLGSVCQHVGAAL